MKPRISFMRRCILVLSTTGCLFFGSVALAQPLQIQHSNGAAFVSGGVGDDAMAALAAIESQYDLKLLLVGASGAYLSDIQITIIDGQGKGVLLTTTEGPVLLADLPTGAYTVTGQKNGHRIEQSVNVTRDRLRTIYFRFPGE